MCIRDRCNSCFCEAGFNPNANGFWACTEQDCSYGCTDESASNYVDYAIEDDGSCQWLDCDGALSYTSLNILIEDSVCHSNLYCEDYNWDGGDCVFDCNNDLMTIWDIDGYFYNGQCDQILNCMAYNYDNESCLEPQGCEDENGVSYDHGVQWSIDPCSLCSCDNGEISCTTEICQYPICEAPNYFENVQGQCCPICIEVQPESDCTVQNIPIELNVGWGMFGYTCLEPQNVIEAFSSITADIIIVKNSLGNAYLPQWSFNGIGNAQIGYGYYVKTTVISSLTFYGVYLTPEENPITILSGWNIIGYLRTTPSPLDEIFESLVASDLIVIIKDYLGAAYLPEFDFNGIGDLNPGQGYQIKTNGDCILQY